MLLDGGDAVTAVLRPGSRNRSQVPAGAEVCEAHLEASDARLSVLLRDASAVIYAAGAVRGRRLEDFLPANVDGLAATADALAAVNPRCHLVALSSLAASRPELSNYAHSKRLGERVLEERHPGLRWTIFRPTAVYGPGDRELTPLFRLMRRGIIPSLGGPRQRLSFIHVDDLAEALIAALDNPEAVERRIYTLDDGTPGGYDRAAMAASLRPGRRAVFLPVPRLVLAALARCNLWLSTLTGRQPMLTPGKVGELTYEAWLGDNKPFTEATGWKPLYNLSDGALELFGDR